MAKLTKARCARLEKLAAYLEGLRRNYRHFKMDLFIHGRRQPEKTTAEYGRTNGGVQTCGTAACAAGHGPAAGILVPPRMIEGDDVAWGSYCALFVGDDRDADSFLFSGAWSLVDDSHYGAAARIRYLLDKGIPPPWWNWDRATVKLYAPYRVDAKPIPASASSSRAG